MKRSCVQCGKTFFLSDNEVKFYNDRNLSLPKRCKECREENKKNKGDSGKGSSIRDDTQTDDARDGVKDKPAATVSAHQGNSRKSAGKKIAGIAAAVAVIAAGGGVYSQNAASHAAQAPQPAYEYTVESGYTAEPGYTFSNRELLEEHYKKHGKEMGFETPEAYEAAASAVVNDPRALHKLEAEDGDDVYYIEDTNEFVIVSKRGYLRTYFKPDAGKRYYDKQ